MAKYRKKPVVIEARLWSGDFKDWHAMYDFCRVPSPTSVSGSTSVLTGPHPLLGSGTSEKLRVSISTLEGCMFAEPGDWIIRGVKGEFYPCKPDIFEATYEEVSDGK